MAREQEKKWLKEHWDDVLKQYPGQYIALNENQMVCHGLTEEHIHQQVDSINENLNLDITPLIFFVDPSAPQPQIK